MNKYELVYIIDATIEEEARKGLIERFGELITSNGGEITKVEEWGKRRLAYPINYKNEGYYVLVNFSAESELPREIERNLQINESVIRYQIIHVLEKRSSVKPRPVRVAPVVEAPAAPVAQPAVETAPAEEAPANE